MNRGFSHEALFYDGERGFAADVRAFIAEGIAADEPTLVAVPTWNLELLDDAATDPDLHLVDILSVGQNPACLIAVWQEFVERYAPTGRPLRGVGEPIWAGRDAAAVSECHLHEALVNVAFPPGTPLRLVCPYDTEALGPDVAAEARRTHPVVWQHGAPTANPDYRPHDDRFARPLPEPPSAAAALVFDAATLGPLRRAVIRFADDHGIGDDAAGRLVVAANEVATNSVKYGGGTGVLRLWTEADAVVCQVDDRGVLREPLAGRSRPATDEEHGRGLWLVNRLCDLVQVRSTADGVTVRLYLAPT